MSEHIECCPFGCKAGLTVYQSIDCEYVICDSCESTGPAAKTREEAIAAWNKRAQPVGEARPPAAANQAGIPEALRWAASIVQLYDDATMNADYMIDANDAEQILVALAGYTERFAAPLPESHALGGDGTE